MPLHRLWQELSWRKRYQKNDLERDKMNREVDIKEISDGRLYELNDMVKADCHDCQGCCECCRGMGDTVVLDPLDVHRLSVHLEKEPEKLLERELALGIFDGSILPYLRMEGKDESCVFLSSQGRCSIHPARPGFCRLFPLGRYYENSGFKYFLQIHECPKTNRSKIKVRKWIDTPDVKLYERFITDWHYFLKDVQAVLYKTEDTELIKNLNMYVVSRFYLKSYQREEDFYCQFYKRLKEGKELLSLGC